MNLKQQRAARIAAQQAIVDGAAAAGRELTAEENEQYEALQREINELTLKIEAEEAEQSKQAAPAASEDPEGASREAAAAETKRALDITALCRQFDVTPDEYIRKGFSVEQTKSAILDSLYTTGQPVHVAVTRDETDTFKERATDALMMRAGVTVEKPADGARELRNLSLRDLAIKCLAREGEDLEGLMNKSSDELYVMLGSRAYYNPTAVFPAILDNTIEKSIVQLYDEVPTTFQAFTTKGSLQDFKESRDHEYVIGGLRDFEEVPEGGEIKADLPRTELLPTRQLKTYGKQFTMSRQAFINDDIGFLTEVPKLYAAKAKKTIDKQVYSILFNNSKIFDGTALFTEKHSNLMSKASAPSQSAIQAMITKMEMQTDQFGEAIYITPAFVIVPIGYEFDMAVILKSANVTGSANNDINPLYNYPLTVIQSPVLNAFAGEDACPWFMVADPTSCRGIQVDYLNGNEVPTVRRMETPGTLGFVWDIYHDWGITVRDFRGIVRNDGVVIDTQD